MLTVYNLYKKEERERRGGERGRGRDGGEREREERDIEKD